MPFSVVHCSNHSFSSILYGSATNRLINFARWLLNDQFKSDASFTATKSFTVCCASANPNKYLVDKNGQWSAAAANEYMVTALTSCSEASGNMIELVICNNDGMAEGAVSALNGAGYNLGGDSKMIPVFGVDATDAAKNLIKDGKMSGTIKQDATEMAELIEELAENVVIDKDALLEGLENYNMDANVNKIRISYSKYLG